MTPVTAHNPADGHSQLPKADRRLLAALAEYRVLTTGQIAQLLGRNDRALRRRLSELRDQGLIEVERSNVSGRGRPENQAFLTKAGVNQLKKLTLLANDIPVDWVLPGNLVHSSHQRMVNWFRVYLEALPSSQPSLSVSFLAPNSPTISRDRSGLVSIAERAIVTETGGDQVRFTPDGVFHVMHVERQKALLFFLEIDMGTETLRGGHGGGHDVQQKIINYREYFRTERYKRYEGSWACQFNGFRLLFVADTPGRCEALCRVVCQAPDSEFIWLTAHERIAAQGLAAPIWFRGGRLDHPPRSILGSQSNPQVVASPGT